MCQIGWEMFLEEVGCLNKVAGYRVMLGLKQSEMASQMNISRQAYSQKENGKIPFKDKEKVFLKEKFKVLYPNSTFAPRNVEALLEIAGQSGQPFSHLTFKNVHV